MGPAHPLTVAFTEYVPEPAVVTAAMVGFCEAEVKLLGPVHEYVAPPIAEAVSDNVFPEQTAELLPAMGAEGSGVITTAVVPTGPVHPAAEVAVTE